MRKGNHPELLLDPQGEIFALATGADATSEHEWGCDPLMTELTGQAPLKRAEVAQALRERKLSQVPDILQGRRICRDLDELLFQTGTEQGEPVAALGYTARGHELNLLAHPELAFNRFAQPQDLAGAWDDASFGFKVKGDKQVQRLERFYLALHQGQGMFAGLFLSDQPKQRLGGVIVCNTDLLRPEHRSAMKKAQADFEAEVQMHLQARTAELLSKAAKVFTGHSRSFGHVWPRWKGSVCGSEIVYGYNPGYGLSDALYGFYSFEELSSWLDNKAEGAIRATS